MRSSVVLPAPFGPSSPVTPGPIDNVTSSSACVERNDLVTLSTSTVFIVSPPMACPISKRSWRIYQHQGYRGNDRQNDLATRAESDEPVDHRPASARRGAQRSSAPTTRRPPPPWPPGLASQLATTIVTADMQTDGSSHAAAVHPHVGNATANSPVTAARGTTTAGRPPSEQQLEPRCGRGDDQLASGIVGPRTRMPPRSPPTSGAATRNR